MALKPSPRSQLHQVGRGADLEMGNRVVAKASAIYEGVIAAAAGERVGAMLHHGHLNPKRLGK